MDSVNPLNLSDLIDELRSLDLGHLIDSPKFVICGSPSCGKSSVLDALINVPFPTSETPCTAFPTEIIFRRSPIASCHVSLEPAASLSKSIRQELEGFAGDNFHWRKLPELISRAKKWMGITGSLPASAANVLKVVISKPDHSNMTFVDLPGLYDPADADDPRRLMVSALVQRYLKDPINVILPVIGAETNDSPDGLLRFVEHFDPRHERTLAIVTQLDRLAQISDKTEMFLRLLNDQPLPLGFHALVNRSSETNDISRAERNKREKDFFGRGKWATASRKFVGSGSLLLRLESLVEDHIKRHLSVTMGCITKGVLDCQRRLGDLGHPRATLKEQRGYLFNVSGNFERITSQALNGMYVNDFFVGKDTLENPRKIRAIINSLNETFLEIMRSKGCRRRIVDQRLLPQSTPVETPSYYQEAPEPETVYRADLELEIEDKLRQGRSIESPGYANPLAVGDLFRHQSSMWEALAEDHLLMVSECVRHFVELLLNHLTSEHTCKKLMTMVFDSALEKMKNDMFQKLQELNSYHQRRRPIPLDERLLASRQRIQFDHADRSKPGNTKGGASEIIDLVQTYYNVGASFPFGNTDHIRWPCRRSLTTS